MDLIQCLMGLEEDVNPPQQIGNTFNLYFFGMSSDMSYVFNLGALETLWSKSATSMEKYTDIDGKVNVDAKNVNVERGTETDCSLKVSQACNERAARRYWWRWVS